MQPQVSAVDDNFVGSVDKTAGARQPAQARPADWQSGRGAARPARARHSAAAHVSVDQPAVRQRDRGLPARAGLARDPRSADVPRHAVRAAVDDIPTGRGTQVGHELARRLHKASVASVTIDRAATPREIGRFCEDLVRCGERDNSADAARDDDRARHRPRHRGDGLPAGGARGRDVSGRRGGGRRRGSGRVSTRSWPRAASSTTCIHRRKGGSGSIRASAPPSVSLLDLAVLADNPATLASMLLRLTDDADGRASRRTRSSRSTATSRC